MSASLIGNGHHMNACLGIIASSDAWQRNTLRAGPDIMWSANTACPHPYSHIIGPFNTTLQSMPQGLIYSGSHLCLNTPVFSDGKFMVGKARWFDIAAYGLHKQ